MAGLAASRRVGCSGWGSAVLCSVAQHTQKSAECSHLDTRKYACLVGRHAAYHLGYRYQLEAGWFVLTSRVHGCYFALSRCGGGCHPRRFPDPAGKNKGMMKEKCRTSLICGILIL